MKDGTWAWVIACWNTNKKLKFRRLGWVEDQAIFLYLYLGEDDEVLCKYPDIPETEGYEDMISLDLNDFNGTDWIIVND